MLQLLRSAPGPSRNYCAAHQLQLFNFNRKLTVVHTPIRANAFFGPSTLPADCWRFLWNYATVPELGRPITGLQERLATKHGFANWMHSHPRWQTLGARGSRARPTSVQYQVLENTPAKARHRHVSPELKAIRDLAHADAERAQDASNSSTRV